MSSAPGENLNGAGGRGGGTKGRGNSGVNGDRDCGTKTPETLMAKTLENVKAGEK